MSEREQVSGKIKEIQARIQPRASLGKQQLKEEGIKRLKRFNNRRTSRRR